VVDVRKFKKLGMFLYYLLWPLVWFYAPLKTRVRVLLIYKDEVLLVKNWFGPNIWQLPGGGTKIGESSTATAAREINEELGIKINLGAIRLLNEIPLTVRSRGLILRYQYAYVDLQSKPRVVMSSEITDVMWTHLSKLDVPKTISTTLL
jgi:8-oxo-dGTP pyrophosphatase MutT (NUDIX family)